MRAPKRNNPVPTPGDEFYTKSRKKGPPLKRKIVSVTACINPRTGKADKMIEMAPEEGTTGHRTTVFYERTFRIGSNYWPVSYGPDGVAPGPATYDPTDVEAAKRLIVTARDAVASLEAIIARMK